jgi:uncharacterized membrane protein
MLWLAVVVLAVLAMRRIGKLEKRLAALERRLPDADAGLAPGAVGAEPVAASVVDDVGAPSPHHLPGETRDAPSGIDDGAGPPPFDEPLGAPPPQPRTRPAIDWERWIGVQGAAVAGGVVLALAGVLLFKYSIDQGLISPAVRVIGATLVGLACLVAVQMRWRHDYPSTADALAGAGVVILYAAFWAAKALYGFIGMPVAFLLMSLVTASCCLLSMRHDSKLVALLGLTGGFLTPLLISTGSDRPLGLFGYVLVLDLALLEVARRQRWPVLAPLSLAGTVVLQLLWVAFRMGPDRLWLGLGVLAVFALLYAFYGERTRPPGDGPDQRAWAWSQTAALLSPVAFAIYFAARAELTPHVWQLGLVFAGLSAAASWVASRHGDARLAQMAAAGSVAVVTVWLLRQDLTTPLAWEAMGVSLLLALVFHAFAERDHADGPSRAAVIAATTPLVVTIVVSLNALDVAPEPWLAGWLALTALLARHAALPGRARLHYVAAGGLGAGLGLLGISRVDTVFVEPPLALAVLVGAAVLGRIVAHRAHDRPDGAEADAASALLALLLLGSLVFSPLAESAHALPFLTASLLLALVALMAAATRGLGRASLATTIVTAMAQTAWVARALTADDEAGTALVMVLVSIVLLTAWPLVAGGVLREQRTAWWGSALAGPFLFAAVLQLWNTRFGDAAFGLPPLILAAVTLAAAARGRMFFPEGSPRQVSVLAWYLGVTLGFVSVAIPLQLEKEWITIGWALEGAALTALWRRLDHPGLKWLAVALLGAVTVRLVGNAALLEYHERSSWRIVNWLLYTYLVPAAALLGAAVMLRPLEVERIRPRERLVYQWDKPILASAFGLGALAVVFVWINLAIADWFSTGPYLTVSFDRMPARDLTTSIAWALYALVLLAVGLARGLSALRWVSLAVLIVTIAKVFLYDLGELRDLYRVASLAGLAFSLILVSLAYQRFVFRKPRTEEAG